MRISDWSSDVCSSDLCLTPLDAVGPGASVVPKGVDELALVHLRPTLDADLARPVEQLVLGAVLVVLGLATALAHLAAPPVARRVRAPRRSQERRVGTARATTRSPRRPPPPSTQP